MVKVLLSLKWRYFLASFKKNAWVIISIIFGGLYGLGSLGLWMALAYWGGTDPEANNNVYAVLAFGLVLSLLWWIVPIFTSGMDATLDPDHLSPYPLRRRDLQVGQLLGGFIGIPGVLTLLFTLATALFFIQQPFTLVLYLACAVLGLCLILSLSRAVSLIAIELNAIPQVRQILLILSFLIAMSAGLLIMVITSILDDFWDQLPAVGRFVQWTPLGAPWAAPIAVYQGNWVLFTGLLAVSAVYVAGAWALWNVLLKRSMNKMGAASNHASGKAVELGNVGLFDKFPATARGAIAARVVLMLLRDQRANMNIVMIPAFYLLFGVIGRVQLGPDESPTVFSMNPFVMVFAPMMAGYVYAYLVSYENSAFSMHVLAPLRGKDDRWGRAWGLSIMMVPLIIVGSVILCALGRDFSSLPLLLAFSLSLYMSSVGISAFVDMVISVPVPGPKSSPWKVQQQNDGLAKGLVRMLLMLVMAAFALPGGILWLVYLATGSAVWMWAMIVVCLVVGSGTLFTGMHLGAKRYDRLADQTLQRVSQFR